jgi:hypothetical protein
VFSTDRMSSLVSSCTVYPFTYKYNVFSWIDPMAKPSSRSAGVHRHACVACRGQFDLVLSREGVSTSCAKEAHNCLYGKYHRAKVFLEINSTANSHYQNERRGCLNET